MDFYANIMAALILNVNIFVFCFYTGGVVILVLYFERGRSHVSLTSSSRDSSMMVI